MQGIFWCLVSCSFSPPVLVGAAGGNQGWSLHGEKVISMSSEHLGLPAGCGEVAGVGAGNSSMRAVPWFLPEFPIS